jgi:hypothetical protein
VQFRIVIDGATVFLIIVITISVLGISLALLSRW